MSAGLGRFQGVTRAAITMMGVQIAGTPLRAKPPALSGLQTSSIRKQRRVVLTCRDRLPSGGGHQRYEIQL